MNCRKKHNCFPEKKLHRQRLGMSIVSSQSHGDGESQYDRHPCPSIGYSTDKDVRRTRETVD